jgi:hypothetical protein
VKGTYIKQIERKKEKKLMELFMGYKKLIITKDNT